MSRYEAIERLRRCEMCKGEGEVLIHENGVARLVRCPTKHARRKVEGLMAQLLRTKRKS